MVSLEKLAEYIGFLEVPKAWVAGWNGYQGCETALKSLITPDFIAGALDFYDIDDVYLQDRIYNVFALMQDDEMLRQYVYFMHYLLFVDESGAYFQLRGLAHTPEMLALHDNFYFNALVLLGGYQKHQKTFEKYHYDLAQQVYHKVCVKGCCFKDKKVYGVDGVGFSQMLRAAKLINGVIFGIDSVEYEVATIDKHRDFTDISYNQGDTCIKIHIPASIGRLDRDKVIKSVAKAKIMVCDSYKMKELPYVCQSWLLSPDLTPLLGPASNILAFQHLFDIDVDSPNNKQFVKYVFNQSFIPDDYHDLPESTSLQRQIRQAFINGAVFCGGYGVFQYEN